MTHWGFLFALIAIASTFHWLNRQQDSADSVKLPGVQEPVQKRHLWWAWAAGSAVLCVVTGALADLFWTVGVTVIVVLVHGSLHIVPIHIFIYTHY
jgi:hypothetical protein